MITSQSSTHHPTRDEPVLREWSPASHAHLEVVEDEDKDENDAGRTLRPRVEPFQPEPSNNVPGLEPSSYDRSDMDDTSAGAARVENIAEQVTKRLNAVGSDGSEDRMRRSPARPLSIPIPKPKPVVYSVPDSPSSGVLFEPIILAINSL